MDVIHSDKKSFDQMNDKQLDDYILTDPPFMANAIAERNRRSSNRMIETQDKMLELAKKLDLQTAVLIRLTRFIIWFTIILVIFTIGLFTQGFLQFFEARKNAQQPAQQIQQTNQANQVSQTKQPPK
jgi:hypothetical protein